MESAADVELCCGYTGLVCVCDVFVSGYPRLQYSGDFLLGGRGRQVRGRRETLEMIIWYI